MRIDRMYGEPVIDRPESIPAEEICEYMAKQLDEWYDKKIQRLIEIENERERYRSSYWDTVRRKTDTHKMSVNERLVIYGCDNSVLSDELKSEYEKIVKSRGLSYEQDRYVETNLGKVAMWMNGKNRKLGLMLIGNVGAGKTTMMSAMKMVYENRCGVVMQIHSAHDIVRKAMQADPYDFDQIKKYPLIGLDDLGVESESAKVYGNEINPIVELVEARYNACLVTLVTTNLSLDAIRGKYGERTSDRMKEMCNVYVLDGSHASFRR